MTWRYLITKSQLAAAIRFGLIAGFSMALLLSVYFTAYDWWFNPGGLFRGPEGTAWDIVYDTASSWLLPAFVDLAPIAIMLHLAWTTIRQQLAGKTESGKQN